MYKYETHLHTYPVSRCGHVGVEDNLRFYKEIGYDGVFITNHFLDGNVNLDGDVPYEEAINFYFSDYEKGVEIGKEIGLKVFLGVELSLLGTDFLIYGLDKEWFLAHPEIMDMKKSEELRLMKDSGALVIQAHPFREEFYIDHIRLEQGYAPADMRYVHGVEVFNVGNDDMENKIGKLYAEHYGLIPFSGSDNHLGKDNKRLAGVSCDEPVTSEQDFAEKVKSGRTGICGCTVSSWFML